MDSSSSSIGTIQVQKLRDDNYHVWKHRIELILGLRDLDDCIEDEPPTPDTSDEYLAWRRRDKKAKGIIALSLGDDHLEQVQHASSAKEMWHFIADIFEKHTLLNKLAARRRFYTAKMGDTEKVRSFAARIRQLASTLKSMGVDVKDNEMAMALLCGLPERFDSLISALDTTVTDEKIFTFSFVLGRVEQEEQRHSDRVHESIIKAETAALVASQTKPGMCIHCGKHPDSSKCYLKYPHLAPEGHPARQNALALMNRDTQEPAPDSNFICLAFITDTDQETSADTMDEYASTAHLLDSRSAFTDRIWDVKKKKFIMAQDVYVDQSENIFDESQTSDSAAEAQPEVKEHELKNGPKAIEKISKCDTSASDKGGSDFCLAQGVVYQQICDPAIIIPAPG